MWSQSFAILITGMCALAAATKAYRGAVKQSEAIQKISDKQIEKEQISAAAILLAELSSISLQLVRFGYQALHFQSAAGVFAQSLPSKFVAYDYDPMVVANLPPHLIPAVVQRYENLRSMLHHQKEFWSEKDREEYEFKIVLRTAIDCGESARITILDLAGIARNPAVFEKWERDIEKAREDANFFIQWRKE